MLSFIPTFLPKPWPPARDIPTWAPFAASCCAGILGRPLNSPKSSTRLGSTFFAISVTWIGVRKSWIRGNLKCRNLFLEPPARQRFIAVKCYKTLLSRESFSTSNSSPIAKTRTWPGVLNCWVGNAFTLPEPWHGMCAASHPNAAKSYHWPSIGIPSRIVF